MFQENPFSGVCAYAMWEVILMLSGTLLLGLLLGYLVWGWTRRKMLLAEKQIASMTTTNMKLEQQLSTLMKENTDKQHEVDLLNDANASLNKQVYTINVENAGLKKEISASAESPEETKSEIAKLKSVIASNEALITTLYTQLSEAQTRTADVENMLDKMSSGKSDAVKSITDNATHSTPDAISPAVKPLDFFKSLSAEIQEEEEHPQEPVMLAQASEIFGIEVVFNDFTIIEGIGPKIAEVLRKSGITSWSKLSNTTRHILRVILDEAGGQFRGHKPKTWPRQARMAANGEWKKLKAYQEILMGGK